jgi:hypothetical protein
MRSVEEALLVLAVVCLWTGAVASMPDKVRTVVGLHALSLGLAIFVGGFAGTVADEIIRNVDPHHYDGEYHRYIWGGRIGVGFLAYLSVAKPWKHLP